MSANPVPVTPDSIMEPALTGVASVSANRTTNLVTNIMTAISALLDTTTSRTAKSVIATSMEPKETFVSSLSETVPAFLPSRERPVETARKDTMGTLTVIPVDVMAQELNGLQKTSVTLKMGSVSVLMDSLEELVISARLATTVILHVDHVLVTSLGQQKRSVTDPMATVSVKKAIQDPDAINVLQDSMGFQTVLHVTVT